MGLRGPKPASKLAVINPGKSKYPKPLPGMTSPARYVWKRIVKAYPADHFKPQHLDQLRGYCEAAAGFKKAVSEISKTGQVITQDNGVLKRNPWTLERDACGALMAQLGTKLGINKNSTTARTEPGKGPKRKSKFEGLLFGDRV